MNSTKVFGLKPHEGFSRKSCRDFAQDFGHTIKADQDSMEVYVGNLGVLVRVPIYYHNHACIYNFYTCSEDSAWRNVMPA